MSFKDKGGRERDMKYYLPTVEQKDYNVINFFGLPIKNDLKTYDNIRKIATGQGDDYATGCLFHKTS